MSPSNLAKVVVFVMLTIGCPRLSDAGGLTVAWDPPTDGVTTGYVLFYGTTPQSYSQQVDVGGTTSFILSDLQDGATYYFALRAYDAMGAISEPSEEVVATVSPAPPPLVTALTLGSSVPSPQMVGTTVTWLSTATGGVAPYEFQWALHAAGQWTALAWTNAATWTWTPSTPGNDYQVKVAVRSSGNSSTTGELNQVVPFAVTALPVASIALTANMAAPQTVGRTILWSAAVAGGTAPHQYQWWVFNGSAWSAATAWTTSSTWSWTPTVAGAGYIVLVWVRSAGNSTDVFEASAVVPFPIIPCRGPKCR